MPRRGYCVEVSKICVRPVSVRPSVRPSVATLFGPGIWFVHDWYWTVRGSKKWSKLCKSTKMDHGFGSFTTGIGRFEVQKWVRNSHNRHFGATLPCGCYLVLIQFCDLMHFQYNEFMQFRSSTYDILRRPSLDRSRGAKNSER